MTSIGVRNRAAGSGCLGRWTATVNGEREDERGAAPGPAEDAVTPPPCARAMSRAMVSPMPEPLERRGWPGAR